MQNCVASIKQISLGVVVLINPGKKRWLSEFFASFQVVFVCHVQPLLGPIDSLVFL